MSWTDIGSLAVLAAQLAVLAAAAIVAYKQVAEARRLREAQIRPFVVLDFDGTEDETFFLTLTNLGTTLAREIKISIDPPLVSALHSDTGGSERLHAWVNQVFPSLAPGKEIRTLFDTGFLRAATELELPEVYSAQVAYRDATLRHDFTEELRLDLRSYKGLGRFKHADIDDIHARLKDIADAVKASRARRPSD